jgi:hypothetical protein
MGKHEGIVSGFFTAVLHALFALPALLLVRGTDGPHTNPVVFACVVVLVCSVGLIIRSHFSSVILLLLDLVLLALATGWLVMLVLAFQNLTLPDAGSVTVALEKTRHILKLAASALSVLLLAWLTLRTYRLEKRLRRLPRSR